VTETVVFGAGRSYLGILVIPSAATEEMKEADVVVQI
jgi:hypothetical protein